MTGACLLVALGGLAVPAAASLRLPRRALWIETSANLPALSSRASIRELVTRARAAGIDTLIPEAKNAWGFVIYESDIAPHVRASPVARAGYRAPATWFPPDLDPLGVLIEEARVAGLGVHAAVNVFGEGLVPEPGSPPVGVVQHHPEWVSIHLRPGPRGAAFVPATRIGPIVFANPSHPEVQAYELAVLWEIVSRYDVDGIVLDRARYAGVDADFSDLSRRQFEEFLGRPLRRWPDDVARPAADGVRPGLLFREWVAWRASVIRAHVRAAGRVTRQIRSGVRVGMYVGAWFPAIFEVGQNWARADASLSSHAWSPAWNATSLLPELDYLMVGLYYRTVTRWDAMRAGHSSLATVIGSALRSRELTRGTPLLGTVWLDLYRGNPAAGEGAIRAAARLTDGVVVFDLSNVEQDRWWRALPAR
ncbi:MAG: family 10 glycosylhydrolase [Armatimonadota bacterium]|nr:family 10 glycosylhydrolase [Armatimonadota bacterium]